MAVWHKSYQQIDQVITMVVLEVTLLFSWTAYDFSDFLEAIQDQSLASLVHGDQWLNWEVKMKGSRTLVEIQS